MIAFLDGRGYAYGGTLRAERARLHLPECLHTEGAKVDPRTVDDCTVVLIDVLGDAWHAAE